MSYHKPGCPEERAYDIAQDVLKRMRLDAPTADAVFVEIAAIGARASGLTIADSRCRSSTS